MSLPFVSEEVLSFHACISPTAFFSPCPVSIEIVDLSFIQLRLCAYTMPYTMHTQHTLTSPLSACASYCFKHFQRNSSKEVKYFCCSLDGFIFVMFISRRFSFGVYRKKGIKPMKNVWKRWVDFNNSIISVNVKLKASWNSD